jgi:D-tyrosyl-tRNA(Tyr) deacylase
VKVLVQRVLSSEIHVAGESIAKIGQGMLVFLGIEKEDDSEKLANMVKKISEFRMFADEAGKMNLSILDKSYELLLVSQFTLAGNTSRGRRPSFDSAAKPDHAKALYEQAIKAFQETGLKVQTGQFAADMKISLINDGPVSFHFDF